MRGGPGSTWTGERASRGTRGRNLRGLLGLLRPYRGRAALAVIALVLGTAAALAPPLLARAAIDDGIQRHDFTKLVLVVVAFMASSQMLPRRAMCTRKCRWPLGMYSLASSW